MPDIIEQLTSDHRKVEQLFKEYESAQDDKTAIVGQIQKELQTHTTIEENVVYPVVKERLANGEDEATHAVEEHNEVDSILEQLVADPANKNAFDELRDKVLHHASEEESEMFPQLRESVDQAQLDEMAQQSEQYR